MKVLRVLALAISAITSPLLLAVPQVTGVVDAGYSGGYHYFTIYVSCDSGFYCQVQPTLADKWQQIGGYLGSASYSYWGVSGFSPYVMQINIYATPGTSTTIGLNYQSWGPGYQTIPPYPGNVTGAPFLVNF